MGWKLLGNYADYKSTTEREWQGVKSLWDFVPFP